MGDMEIFRDAYLDADNEDEAFSMAHQLSRVLYHMAIGMTSHLDGGNRDDLSALDAADLELVFDASHALMLSLDKMREFRKFRNQEAKAGA